LSDCTTSVKRRKTARLSVALRQFCLSYNLAFYRYGSAVMPLLSDRRWAVALLFMTPALWSVNYLVGRLAPGLIAPHMLALLRWSLAGLVLAVFAWPELVAKKSSLLKNSWHFMVLGALGMWICGVWVYIGARSTSATNIALIYTLSPVFIALVSTVWLRERLGLMQWLGIALAFVGLVHVVIRGRWVALAEVRLVAGDLWILGATVSWTLYSIFLKRWPSDFSPMARLVLIISAGVLLLVPLTVLEALSGLPMTQTIWGWRTVALALAAALVPGAGAYLAYATLQKALGAARAGLTLYLSPLYVAVTAFLVLGEPMYFYHLVGAAAMLPGIYLASRTKQ
jgi:drug/metabolite transporter (DMT)-like permease